MVLPVTTNRVVVLEGTTHNVYTVLTDSVLTEYVPFHVTLAAKSYDSRLTIVHG